MVRLDSLADLAAQFVLVRLTRIAGADLNVFEFDYDLNWFGFFLSADERVYGRYGGRDAASAESRLSLRGLRYAMQAALAAHRRQPPDPPKVPKKDPLRAEDFPAARRLAARECIHCHQVAEFRREQRQQAGLWSRDELWVYPLPENVGLTLDVDQGDRVRRVEPESPAARAGLQPGDLVRRLNGYPVASFADAQYALHKAPVRGQIPVEWQRGGGTHRGQLDLADGWRKTNLTWRPSMLDLLPSLGLYGDDLSAAEKKALGLGAKRLAFRQDENPGPDARTAGVQPGDVVLGIDGREQEMTLREFLAHVRRNYLVGDRVTLHVLRDGKRLNLPLTLR